MTRTIHHATEMVCLCPVAILSFAERKQRRATRQQGRKQQGLPPPSIRFRFKSWERARRPARRLVRDGLREACGGARACSSTRTSTNSLQACTNEDEKRRAALQTTETTVVFLRPLVFLNTTNRLMVPAFR